MPNYKIIVNPTSGRGTGEKSIPIIEQQLKKYDSNKKTGRFKPEGYA